MGNNNFDLRPLLYICIAIGVIAMAIIWLTSSLLGSDEIKVKKPLVPDLVIHSENGVSDTTYVYKIP